MRVENLFYKVSFWFRLLLARRKLDQELDDEIAYHLQAKTEQNIAEGMMPEEARRAAQIDLGGVEQVKEKVRSIRTGAWLEMLLQDTRFGLRMLRKSPGFTAVAILSLALGMGANTAIFSVIQALLLRSLPVPNPQDLLQVNITINGSTSESFSYPVIRALSERKDVFINLGGFCGNTFMVGPADAPVRTPGAFVSGDFFPALQLQPAAGRLLTPEDDQPGATLVAVISDSYWERMFHRDMHAVGANVLVEGHATSIVGVTPPGFTGATVGEIDDFTMAFQARAQLFPNGADLLQAGNQYIRILARPAPGLTRSQVRARLKVLWPPIAAVSVTPKTPPKRREAMLASSLDVAPGGTGWTPLRNQFAKPLYILFSVAGLVLLIACANVANLLLARSTARRREIAVRLALGASRERVVRQLLVESMLLASGGAAFGLLFARIGSALLLRLASSGSRPPILLSVGLDGPVFAFTAAATVLTGLLFGIAPALRATALDPSPTLKISEGTASHSSSGLAPALGSLQIALSLLLLVGAGLFVRTLRNLQAIDPGFRHEGVLLLDIDARRALPALGIQNDARITGFFRDGLDAISHVNGVRSVSVSNFTPISGGIWTDSVLVNSQRLSDESVVFFGVSPRFFETLGIPVLTGRDFTMHDDDGAQPVVIVNQEFVRRFIANGNPLGQHVSMADSPDFQNMEVIGIAASSIPYSLRDPMRASAFVPFFQLPPGRRGFATFEIHASGSLSAVSSGVEEAIRSRIPGVPVKTRSFTAQVEDSIRREILMAQLAGFFGVLALILATVGLYGLLAYMVTRRTSEIGVRMALGAQRSQVLWMVFKSALRLVVIGVLIGLPVVWVVSRLISGLLYGLAPTDPVTMVVSTLLLVTTAVVASFVPARRAVRIAPIVALRYE